MTDDDILVTGAAGFLGSAVVRRALARGLRVRVLVRPGSPLRNLEGLPPLRVVVGDGARHGGRALPVSCRRRLSAVGAEPR
jgi:dihydroflavonol-4-reductase